jgi:hypothetical protein
VKQLLAIILACTCMHSHAQAYGGNSGVGHGARAGIGAHGNASNGNAIGASQSGANGGRYSAFDNYQPWLQAEMQQYAKAKFTPYTGE